MSEAPSYELLRSKRKTLALEITADCRVLVRAPLRLSQKRIDQFVADHAGWVETHLARQQARRDRHPEPTEEERAASAGPGTICRGGWSSTPA